MKKQRERLIELISKVQYMGGLEEKLADHLLADGVIVTPYSVGDKMYTIYGNQLKEWKVWLAGYDYYHGKFEIHLVTEDYEELIVLQNFELHKTVFLTKEEAEQALAERDNQ